MGSMSNSQHEKVYRKLLYMLQDQLMCFACLNKTSRMAKVACLSWNDVVESCVVLLRNLLKAAWVFQFLWLDNMKHVDLGVESFCKGDCVGRRMRNGGIQFRRIENTMKWTRLAIKGGNQRAYRERRPVRGAQNYSPISRSTCLTIIRSSAGGMTRTFTGE